MRKSLLTKYIYILFTLIVSIVLTSACDPPKQKIKAVFIFCDVTGSLIKEESEQVAELTADILDKLPSNSKYRLIPIHMKTDISEVILQNNEKIEGDIPLSLKEARREKLKTEITKIYEFVNSKERKPERTCILSGLYRARDFYLNLKENVDKVEYEYELIFISDMLEDCLNTPAGENKLVSIKDQSPSEAIELIKSAPLPDLSPFRITIVLPGKDVALSKKSVKKDVQTLNIFWSEVFNKCNNKVTVDDWITADAPVRVLTPQTE